MKKQKWFSWGWLIFWAILSPVFGIIYLLIKHWGEEE